MTLPKKLKITTPPVITGGSDRPCKKGVVAYDRFTGKKVATFKNYNEAALTFGYYAGNVVHACTGYAKRCGDHIFRWAEEEQKVKPVGARVIAYSLNGGRVVGVCNDSREMGKRIGIDPNIVLNSLNGVSMASSKGYVFVQEAPRWKSDLRHRLYKIRHNQAFKRFDWITIPTKEALDLSLLVSADQGNLIMKSS